MKNSVILKTVFWIEAILQSLVLLALFSDFYSLQIGERVETLIFGIIIYLLMAFQVISSIFHIAGGRGRILRFIFILMIPIHIIIETFLSDFFPTDVWFDLSYLYLLSVYYLTLTVALYFTKRESNDA